MNRYLTYILLLLTLVSCKEKLTIVDPLSANAVEIESVEAYLADNITTRAAALDAYNYVGRSTFINNDQMVLTTIKRTESTIPGFHYTGIVYDHVIETGQTSGGWNRDPEKGYAHDKNNPQALLSTHPERIYWSDSHNGHTYIGYSKPQGAFDWTEKTATYGGAGTEGISVYYGSLGDPTQLQTTVGQDANGKDIIINFIDYTNNAGEEPVPDQPGGSTLSYKSGNEKIKKDDILLTWDDNKHAETGGSVAKLSFHHGLAQVRVIVNIQGFSASSTAADSWSVVSGMILKDMLTLYRWRQQSYKAEALDGTYDAANISEIYGSTVSCDQKKDVHLWIPRPDGTGAGVGKQFTFYGLAVPTTMAAESLNLQFTVTYQDPMNPWKDAQKTLPNMKDHTYTAQMSSAIEFRAGHCTTINITLNHNNEQMTVGAEYMDWQLVETPDQGELKKNLTFLEHSDRSKVTILGDPKANEDDATWLYVDNSTNKILDIYGNDGSKGSPFKISTADQLLSFAYEVKGTGRTNAVTYSDISTTTPTNKTIPVDGGFDFTGYYVTLDADITMQRSLEIMHDASGFHTLNSEGNRVAATGGVTWPGIGDAEHPFNGEFDGSFRHINRLYGASFFNTVGEYGIVDHIYISDALGITGSGSIAEKNLGIICGSHVEGDIVDETETTYCGSIVGINSGVLIACSHIGDITGNSNILGALLGKNDGIMVSCYNVGNAKNKATGRPAYAGVGDFTPRSVAYCCYFNKDFYTAQDYLDLDSKIGHVAFPLTTAEMQSNKYVNQAAANPLPTEGTNTGEITDPSVKDDIFFYHWSLNEGLNRAIAYLRGKLVASQVGDTEIEFHAPGTEMTATGVGVTLKKSQVQWLVNHYTTGLSHQFVFTPGTYPRLQ